MPKCDHPECLQEGEFPAPRSRNNLREYYYFCLDHIREYNAKWDFFSGYSQDQLYEQMRKDTAWERPTWNSGISLKMEQRLKDFVRRWTNDTKSYQAAAKKVMSPEAQALETLGLPANADSKTIKRRYRELVKRYHPDKNPDNPKAVERFRVIAQAYSALQTGKTKDL
jgi:DnaJ-domain-containing protein 1